jgi:hypothetical protein
MEEGFLGISQVGLLTFLGQDFGGQQASEWGNCGTHCNWIVEWNALQLDCGRHGDTLSFRVLHMDMVFSRRIELEWF